MITSVIASVQVEGEEKGATKQSTNGLVETLFLFNRGFVAAIKEPVYQMSVFVTKECRVSYSGAIHVYIRERCSPKSVDKNKEMGYIR